jgi:hypothetical protein
MAVTAMFAHNYIKLSLLAMAWCASALRLGGVREDEIDVIEDIMTDDALRFSGEMAPIPNISNTSSTRHAGDYEDGHTLWVFGTHSKTGSSLMRSIASYQADALGYRTCSSSDACGFVESGHRRICDHFSQRGLAQVWFSCGFNYTQLEEARQEALASGKALRVVHLSATRWPTWYRATSIE